MSATKERTGRVGDLGVSSQDSQEMPPILVPQTISAPIDPSQHDFGYQINGAIHRKDKQSDDRGESPQVGLPTLTHTLPNAWECETSVRAQEADTSAHKSTSRTSESFGSEKSRDSFCFSKKRELHRFATPKSLVSARLESESFRDSFHSAQEELAAEEEAGGGVEISSQASSICGWATLKQDGDQYLSGIADGSPEYRDISFWPYMEYHSPLVSPLASPSLLDLDKASTSRSVSPTSSTSLGSNRTIGHEDNEDITPRRSNYSHADADNAEWDQAINYATRAKMSPWSNSCQPIRSPSPIYQANAFRHPKPSPPGSANCLRDSWDNSHVNLRFPKHSISSVDGFYTTESGRCQPYSWTGTDELAAAFNSNKAQSLSSKDSLEPFHNDSNINNHGTPIPKSNIQDVHFPPDVSNGPSGPRSRPSQLSNTSTSLSEREALSDCEARQAKQQDYHLHSEALSIFPTTRRSSSSDTSGNESWSPRTSEIKILENDREAPEPLLPRALHAIESITQSDQHTQRETQTRVHENENEIQHAARMESPLEGRKGTNQPQPQRQSCHHPLTAISLPKDPTSCTRSPTYHQVNPSRSKGGGPDEAASTLPIAPAGFRYLGFKATRPSISEPMGFTHVAGGAHIVSIPLPGSGSAKWGLGEREEGGGMRVSARKRRLKGRCAFKKAWVNLRIWRWRGVGCGWVAWSCLALCLVVMGAGIVLFVKF